MFSSSGLHSSAVVRASGKTYGARPCLQRRVGGGGVILLLLIMIIIRIIIIIIMIVYTYIYIYIYTYVYVYIYICILYIYIYICKWGGVKFGGVSRCILYYSVLSSSGRRALGCLGCLGIDQMGKDPRLTRNAFPRRQGQTTTWWRIHVMTGGGDLYVSLSLYIYINIYTHVYTCYPYINIHVYTYVCVYIYIYIYMYTACVYTYIYIYIHTYVYTYMCMYISLSLYIYICVGAWRRSETWTCLCTSLAEQTCANNRNDYHQ